MFDCWDRAAPELKRFFSLLQLSTLFACLAVCVTGRSEQCGNWIAMFCISHIFISVFAGLCAKKYQAPMKCASICCSSVCPDCAMQPMLWHVRTAYIINVFCLIPHLLICLYLVGQKTYMQYSGYDCTVYCAMYDNVVSDALQLDSFRDNCDKCIFRPGGPFTPKSKKLDNSEIVAECLRVKGYKTYVIPDETSVSSYTVDSDVEEEFVPIPFGDGYCPESVCDKSNLEVTCRTSKHTRIRKEGFASGYNDMCVECSYCNRGIYSSWQETMEAKVPFACSASSRRSYECEWVCNCMGGESSYRHIGREQHRRNRSGSISDPLQSCRNLYNVAMYGLICCVFGGITMVVSIMQVQEINKALEIFTMVCKVGDIVRMPMAFTEPVAAS